MKLFNAVKHWYRGQFIEYRYDPESPILVLRGQWRRHWTARAAHALIDFYRRHWKWVCTSAITILLAVVDYS
jgi:hypothetical protein